MTILRLIALSLIFTTMSCAQKEEGEPQTYHATVSITWDSTTHPDPNFPNGPEEWNEPHVSPIIGMVHSTASTLWTLGGIATDGLKSCAEDGDASALSSEIDGIITAGNALTKFETAGSAAPGVVGFTLSATDKFSRISFASMIAPSPDWIIGLDGYNLKSGGEWQDTIVVNLHAYDAGTKEGETYSYSFGATNPREPIYSRENSAPFSSLPVATITLIRQ